MLTLLPSENAVGVMVCLDSILDTRKGTIKKLYPELIDEVGKSPKYFLRKEDRWDIIDQRLDNSQITLNYQGRNLETIKNSQLTLISRLILDLINKLNLEVVNNNPETSSVFLVINFYPYRLSTELKTEIARYLGYQLGILGMPIAESDVPFNQITPTYLKDNNIKYWYCYHYDHWLRENFEPLGTEKIDESVDVIGCPDVMMFAPKIAYDQKAIDEFIKSIKDCPYSDPFELTRSVHSNIIKFEFLDASAFSELDIEKLVRLEKEDDMEKSKILSTPELAVKEIMERTGECTVLSKTSADKYLDDIDRLVFDLKTFNTKDGVHLFKQRLALLNLTVSKLYSVTPFNSGEDLEQLLDGYALGVDTSEEDYLKTEDFWNSKGVETIKTIDDLESGEKVYRCISVHNYPELGISLGQILNPERLGNVKVNPADVLTFLNYFEN